jgi:hypothetical protein
VECDALTMLGIEQPNLRERPKPPTYSTEDDNELS